MKVDDGIMSLGLIRSGDDGVDMFMMRYIRKSTHTMKRISCVWLVLWLIAIPLIHIHPEADHAHGAQDHQHGGLFHSVFSQDLSCEFHSHQAEHSPSTDQRVTDDSSCQHSHAHHGTHDEIGFSLLSGSSNESLTHQGSPQFYLLSSEISLLNVQHSHPSFFSKPRQSSRFSDATPHIRPPPVDLARLRI